MASREKIRAKNDSPCECTSVIPAACSRINSAVILLDLFKVRHHRLIFHEEQLERVYAKDVKPRDIQKQSDDEDDTNLLNENLLTKAQRFATQFFKYEEKNEAAIGNRNG